MTKKRWMFFILMTAAAAIAGKSCYDTNVFQTKYITFRTRKLPADKSIRLLQISDIHNKQFGRHNKRLINAAMEAEPDMIAVTGDLIDEDTPSIKPMLHLMEALTGVTKNIYFVTGNHDWEHPEVKSFLRGLKERGITVLDNRNTKVEVNGAVFNLAGIEDHYTNRHNLTRAFQGIDEEYYTLLLSHAPLVFQNEKAARADLILSGHTHGGQIRFPFIGGVVSPGEGLFPSYEQGTHFFASGSWIYIDKGLGTSTIPVRFMNQSQMTVVTIEGGE
ncbi:metallophosphoesterase [Salibacterium halotolerans]|uniref:Calcineurin-like phosphoesterase domain-containing protein n=1 Tax=Salibacterium halotolerans TaxID=1884432 RepID=A0A1I5S175_9BACI|nr:metallophosphoesterase [Salibacterium halotolerans]SFP64500.1 hypothetical protein SAMN05518683_10810 [Salibacterium halotolerans]